VTGGREAAVMRVNFLFVVGALVLLAGCGGLPYSDPYGSPDTSRKADCERAGGYWHDRPAVCEPRR
jgi:hypothetical protein